ncbi:MAG: DJ-1/PfpI family protein [Methanomicrobia archaeon]|nr:DJ-1/PfpI family protein [Methanomicrobia archaeon]
MKKIVLPLVVLLILGTCCVSEKKEEKGKILMIIAPKDFRDEELSVPEEIFEKNGYRVYIASTEKEATGMLGKRVSVDYLLEDVDISEYDALVIVGGSGSRYYLWNNRKLIDMVKKAYNEDRVVAAICLSPVVLANSGILKGKEATVFPDPEAVSILKKYAIYKNENVVVSGRIVTASSPKYAKNFAESILEKISE